MIPTVIPNSNFGVWANEINKAVHRQTLVKGNDTLVTSTHNGTVVKNKPTANVDSLGNTIVEYDLNEFYSMGSRMYVTQSFSMSFSGSPFTTSLDTTWECVQMVPSNKYTALLPGIGASGSQYARAVGTNYYPLYPHPTSTDMYWKLVGSPPVTQSQGGMSFKGEWSPSVLYVSQNVVRFTTGSNAGTYCNILNTTATGSSQAPDTGYPYWVSLNIDNTLGNWG